MFWLLLVRLREVLLVSFAKGRVILRRLRCESLLEASNRDCYSTARIKEVSHAGANWGVNLWSETI
jgi:hypothetical protein